MKVGDKIDIRRRYRWRDIRYETATIVKVIDPTELWVVLPGCSNSFVYNPRTS